MPKPRKSAAARKVKDAVLSLAETAVAGMQEKKGKEIITLDLRNLEQSITDFFVVCHGDSVTQVEALAKAVEEEIHKTTGESPWHREGFGNCEWVLLDYVNVVVHIFKQETREFYGIERIWADGIIQTYES